MVAINSEYYWYSILSSSPSETSITCLFQNIPHFALICFCIIFLSAPPLGYFLLACFPVPKNHGASRSCYLPTRKAFLFLVIARTAIGGTNLFKPTQNWAGLGLWWGFGKTQSSSLDPVPRAWIPRAFNHTLGRTLISQIRKSEIDSVLAFRGLQLSSLAFYSTQLRTGQMSSRKDQLCAWDSFNSPFCNSNPLKVQISAGLSASLERSSAKSQVSIFDLKMHPDLVSIPDEKYL